MSATTPSPASIPRTPTSSNIAPSVNSRPSAAPTTPTPARIKLALGSTGAKSNALRSPVNIPATARTDAIEKASRRSTVPVTPTRTASIGSTTGRFTPQSSQSSSFADTSPAGLSPTGTLVNGGNSRSGDDTITIDLSSDSVSPESSSPSAAAPVRKTVVPSIVQKQPGNAQAPRKDLDKEARSELIQISADLASSGLVPAMDLPIIVVIGDQSSGKSSLISVLTEINLPAASAMTTRSPTMLRVTHQAGLSSSQVKISIDFVVDRVGESLPEDQLQISVIQNWIDLPKDLAPAVEKASLAALAPKFSRTTGAFVGTDALLFGLSQPTLATLSPEMLTTNMVIIEVRSSTRTPIEILDYPGIQHCGPGQDKVRRMISDMCQRRNVSILACIEATASEQGVEVVQLIEDLDPDRCRTHHVITKADRAECRDGIPIWGTVAIGNPDLFTIIAPLREPYKEGDTYPGKVGVEEAWWQDQTKPGSPWATVPLACLGVTNLKGRIGALMDARRSEGLCAQVTCLKGKIYELQSALDEFPKPPIGSAYGAVAQQIDGIQKAIHIALNPSIHYKDVSDVLHEFAREMKKTCLVAIPYANNTAEFAQAMASYERCQVELPGWIDGDSVLDVAGLQQIESSHVSFGNLTSDFSGMAEDLARRGQKQWAKWLDATWREVWDNNAQSLAAITETVTDTFPLLGEAFQLIIDEHLAHAERQSLEHAERIIQGETQSIFVLDKMRVDSRIRQAGAILGIDVNPIISPPTPPPSSSSMEPPAKRLRQEQTSPGHLRMACGGFAVDIKTRVAIYILAHLQESSSRIEAFTMIAAKVDRDALMHGIGPALSKGIFEKEREMTTMKELEALLVPDPMIAARKAKAEARLEAAKGLLGRCQAVLKEGGQSK